MQPVNGQYLGTERDGRWWRRDSSPGFFGRGNGRIGSDERGVWYHKLLAADPFYLPWERIQSIDTSTWHAGRWAWGLPIVRVAWRVAQGSLTSGFVIGCRTQDGEAALRELRYEWSGRRGAD